LALTFLPYDGHRLPDEPPLLGPEQPRGSGTAPFVLFTAAQIAGSLAYLALARPDLGPLTVAMCGTAFLGVATATGAYNRGLRCRSRYWHLPDMLPALEPGP
jgi:hypothetical protein